ncbi:ECF RNA polymerase sigma factor EcfG [Pseudosulfitobacter sp. DSM 107133]|nr:ECF RNA polymerase sigma factor EcfG [Pseudosulfitobacter sp. DSM 107133]
MGAMTLGEATRKKPRLARSAKTPRLFRVRVAGLGRTMTTQTPLTRLIPMLTRRARRLTRSHSAADDLVQETLLRLIQRARRGGEIDDLPAYAMRTLTNQARMSWRRAAETEELEEDHATVAPEAPMRLDCADALRVIETLPRDQADLMRLVAGGESSPAQLAKLTGLPQGTVMSRLARARARLRQELEGELN